MKTTSSTEALRRVIRALPRCCSCAVEHAVVWNSDRWGLCEKCFKQVPCGDFAPTHDMRNEIYQALTVLAQEEAKDNVFVSLDVIRDLHRAHSVHDDSATETRDSDPDLGGESG